MFQKQYCCETFEAHAEQACPEHPDRFDCPDAILLYDREAKKAGIILHDGGRSYIEIRYCPFCGKKIRF